MCVPCKGLKQEESFLACTHDRFLFLYYNLAAILNNGIFCLWSIIMTVEKDLGDYLDYMLAKSSGDSM